MNELEQLFEVMQHIIDKRLEDNPKSGVILHKGESNELKMKYTKMKKVLSSLEYHMLIRGEISRYSICKDCQYFDHTGHNSLNHGKCTLAPDKAHPVTNVGRCMGVYDTCWRNTATPVKKKGGAKK